jgi:3-hydroxyisobutyrate dehydrogenase
MTTTELAAQQITPAQTGHRPQTATPVIAFLGTGRMGGPMAANLARAGFRVQAWDRTASQAAALVKDGATTAASPAEAIKGAQILITMLADGAATEQALRGPDGELAIDPGLIWVQMATVGTEWTERFVNTATRYQVSFFDAPVSGSQGPAQAGALTILASGPSWMRAAVAPVFAALGRATWLGPAGSGTRAKLVLNNWLADLAETTAETLSFARQLDLDPAQIVDLLEATSLGSPYATQKARAMLAGDYTPAFALKHALKDADLAAQAATESGAELTLTSALLPRWRRAAAAGHADDDVAAIYATP